MRSYRQTCALAKALDVIGDRWSLLIVRELLIRGACRYTDLRNGLPGIATNLLADRLDDLEEAGVVVREAAPPPIATTLFRLTPRGEELRPVLRAIGRWGSPLLAEASEDDVFQSHWLALPVTSLLGGAVVEGDPVVIEIRAGDEPLVVETVGGVVQTRLGRAERPDGVLTAGPRVVLNLLAGKLDLAEARRQGLTYEGDPEALRRLQALVPAPA